MKYLNDKTDFTPYGDLKGSSVINYLVEFTNFILRNTEWKRKTEVLAGMVDFSKAFNRQNLNILITKHADINVPGWLLELF